MSSHADLNGGEELLPGQVTLPDTDSRRHLEIIISKQQTHIFRHFSNKKTLPRVIERFVLLPPPPLRGLPEDPRAPVGTPDPAPGRGQVRLAQGQRQAGGAQQVHLTGVPLTMAA